MVAEFLTLAWVDQLVEAGRAAGSTLEHASVSVRTEVPDAPAGPIAYVIRLSGGRVTVGDDDLSADVTLRADAGTAVALHRGEISAQHAIATGRLRVSGRLDRIAVAQRLLEALGDVFADVRAATSYPVG